MAPALKVNFKFISLLTTTLVAMASLALWASPGEAHLRDYLFNQEYYTAERGELEVESFNDLTLKEADNSDTYSAKHQLELEYGVTDHLQLAGYAVWKWKKGQEYVYDQWKVEAKYRLFEAGTLPVDIALYAEYANQNGSPPGDSDKLEWKVVLSKTWGNWNATANLIAEKAIQKAEATEFEWTAGVVYAWTPRFTTGLELKETLGTRHQFGWGRSDHSLQLMPTIGWSPTKNTKVLVGPAFGLTRAADDIQLRTMVAIEF